MLANLVGGPVEPQDIAQTVAFLVGPRAGAITRQVLSMSITVRSPLSP